MARGAVYACGYEDETSSPLNASCFLSISVRHLPNHNAVPIFHHGSQSAVLQSEVRADNRMYDTLFSLWPDFYPQPGTRRPMTQPAQMWCLHWNVHDDHPLVIHQQPHECWRTSKRGRKGVKSSVISCIVFAIQLGSLQNVRELRRRRPALVCFNSGPKVERRGMLRTRWTRGQRSSISTRSHYVGRGEIAPHVQLVARRHITVSIFKCPDMSCSEPVLRPLSSWPLALLLVESPALRNTREGES